MESEHIKPVLTVSINDDEICKIAHAELPVEKNPTIEIREQNSRVVFEDYEGFKTVHDLGDSTGWFRFSVRVHDNLACQVDCIFGKDQDLDPEGLINGETLGIRFQPLFLGEARSIEEGFTGHGMFHRGLHYPGMVTPGTVSLSCVCDACRTSFRLQSFHAGFSNCVYMYSDSGRYTLVIPDEVEEAPPALGKADTLSLEELERNLPTAPDGSFFKYMNPLRCPHCSEAFIDFQRFPEDREGEYYGNTYFGESPLLFKKTNV